MGWREFIIITRNYYNSNKQLQISLQIYLGDKLRFVFESSFGMGSNVKINWWRKDESVRYDSEVALTNQVIHLSSSFMEEDSLQMSPDTIVLMFKTQLCLKQLTHL